jgi:hypothetical protein
VRERKRARGREGGRERESERERENPIAFNKRSFHGKNHIFD